MPPHFYVLGKWGMILCVCLLLLFLCLPEAGSTAEPLWPLSLEIAIIAYKELLQGLNM